MLKDTQIKALKPKEKVYLIKDGNGLYMVVNTNGSKKWRYRFYFKNKAKTLSLGAYPEVGAAEARKRLLRAKEMVAHGIDPAAQKKQEAVRSSALLFSKVAEDYLSSRDGNVSAHHLERSESLLRLYATPRFGALPIDTLTHKEIKALVVSLADNGKKASAKKLFGVLKQVFDYAERMDYVEVNICNLLNPSSLITDYKPVKTSTIVKPKEIKKLKENIENYSGHYTTRGAMLFMLFTSLRSANVRQARWNQIDGNVMTIAGREMKAAESFKLPLSTQSMEILEEMKPITGHGTYIFPSLRGDKPMSDNALLSMIRNLGYPKEEFTPHGCRAMFATIANAEGDFNLELIDAQLAHKVGGVVSQAYNRTDYFEKRKTLAQWWGDWLAAL